MNIAILGASSQIAKDLVVSFAAHTDHHCKLFVRDIERFDSVIRRLVEDKQYQLLDYSEFDKTYRFDVVMNFVGVGDPALAKKMGDKIFDVTEQYDKLALSYLHKNPSCKYIFLSSGAVYGGAFNYPVTSESIAQVNINDLKEVDWYAIAKLYAEARHRAAPDLSIIDVRVFNYFSHTQDLAARFFITDLVRSIKNKEVFKTSSSNISRDFISPGDFFGLVSSLIGYEGHINQAVDCYTKAPIDKFKLLDVVSDRFSLQYEILESFSSVNATGEKINYYSRNFSAGVFGYEPKYTSAEGVVHELERVQGIR